MGRLTFDTDTSWKLRLVVSLAGPASFAITEQQRYGEAFRTTGKLASKVGLGHMTAAQDFRGLSVMSQAVVAKDLFNAQSANSLKQKSFRRVSLDTGDHHRRPVSHHLLSKGCRQRVASVGFSELAAVPNVMRITLLGKATTRNDMCAEDRAVRRVFDGAEPQEQEKHTHGVALQHGSGRHTQGTGGARPR